MKTLELSDFLFRQAVYLTQPVAKQYVLKAIVYPDGTVRFRPDLSPVFEDTYADAVCQHLMQNTWRATQAQLREFLLNLNTYLITEGFLL